MKHSLLPWLCVALVFIFVINGDMVSKALIAYMAISAMYIVYSTMFVSSCMFAELGTFNANFSKQYKVQYCLHRLYTYQHSANVRKQCV
jgi:hypothetical protein